MRVVRLYGALGIKYGRKFVLDVASVSEAIRALTCNFPEFERDLIQASNEGIAYIVKCGQQHVSDEELCSSLPLNEDIRIAPIVMGSKRGGIIPIVLGTVLAIAGAVLISSGQAWGSYLVASGISLIIGGIVQMFIPQPKVDSPSEDAENTPSSYFDGAVNTLAQGHPVPVGYGELIVGSAVISAGLTVEQTT